MQTKSSRPKCVLGMRIVLPSPQLIPACTHTAKRMLDPINRNTDQSRTLATLRHPQMPKLLSGGVHVAAANHQIT